MRVDVENLTFTFPDGWNASKFDDSAFYRKQFSKMWQTIKSVDIVAVDEEQTTYLIEVKDYRVATDARPSDLPMIVAQKVFDTLAAQIPCKLNANDTLEQELANAVCSSRKLVIVLHIEQPVRPMGIFRPYDRANLLLKLRQLLKPIHAHPWVLQSSTMGNADWQVQ